METKNNNRIWYSISRLELNKKEAKKLLRGIDLNNPSKCQKTLQTIKKKAEQHGGIQVLNRTLALVESCGDNIPERGMKQLYAIQRQLKLVVQGRNDNA